MADEAPKGNEQQPAEEPDGQPSESQDTTDWKAMARKHERDAKKLRTELAAAQQVSESAAETAVRLAAEEAATATRNELAPALAEARLEAAVLRTVGNKLADPGDALRFIDVTEVTSDDGTVDATKLATAIDALIVAKPYLSSDYKPTGAPPVPGGPRGAGAGAGNGDMNTLLRRAAGRA